MKLSHTFFTGFLFLTGVALPGLVTDASVVDGLNCGSQYYDFILSVRSENTREQFIQDFRRGYCQLNDLMELDDELDTLRENFRTAAFDCADTSPYQEEYHRILMEQYFIRNVQQSPSDVIREKEALELEAAKEAILTGLKADMIAVFVVEEGRVSEPVLNDYFDSWTLKYEDRIGNYYRCEEGGFAEIKESWDDFVETIETLSVDIEPHEKISFKDNIKFDNDLDEETEQLQDIGQNTIDGWSYYKNLMGIGKNTVEAPAKVSDFDGTGEVFTFGSALDILQSDTTRATIQAESAERMAKYKLLYGEGGAVAATDMQGVLQYMNQIIAETNAKDFPGVLTGVTKVYERQCN
ncbi:MAG: hypothetical protein AAB383_04640 [Patescibacteria group bacterium]